MEQDKHVGSSQRPEYRILVDENMPRAARTALQQLYGRANHVWDNRWQGVKDPELWQKAIQHGYEAIYTRDRTNKTDQDLSRVASDHRRQLSLSRAFREKNYDRCPILIYAPKSSEHDQDEGWWLEALSKSTRDVIALIESFDINETPITVRLNQQGDIIGLRSLRAELARVEEEALAHLPIGRFEADLRVYQRRLPHLDPVDVRQIVGTIHAMKFGYARDQPGTNMDLEYNAA